MSEMHKPYVPYFRVIDKSRPQSEIVVFLKDGYMVPFNCSHRRFAHLFAGLAAERDATGNDIRHLLDYASERYAALPDSASKAVSVDE
jgi:hypothetical protein